MNPTNKNIETPFFITTGSTCKKTVTFGKAKQAFFYKDKYPLIIHDLNYRYHTNKTLINRDISLTKSIKRINAYSKKIDIENPSINANELFKILIKNTKCLVINGYKDLPQKTELVTIKTFFGHLHRVYNKICYINKSQYKLQNQIDSIYYILSNYKVDGIKLKYILKNYKEEFFYKKITESDINIKETTKALDLCCRLIVLINEMLKISHIDVKVKTPEALEILFPSILIP